MKVPHHRVLGLAGIAGVTIFVLAVFALHVLQPSLSPLDEAVSYYVHGRYGGLLTVGLIALGIGSLSLVFGLAQELRGRSAKMGLILLGVWALGVLLGGIFSADPPGQWDSPPSVAGMIHGNAALVAFLALPLGAFCLARACRQNDRWRRDMRLYFALAAATAISLVFFFASLIPVFVRPGPPVLLGLSERFLLALYTASLTAMAIGLIQRGSQQALTDEPERRN